MNRKWVLLFLILLVSSCSSFQKNLDLSDMEDNARPLLEHYDPGRPQDLIAYLDAASLESASKPGNINDFLLTPLDVWQMEHPLGHPLIQEKITFSSPIREGMTAVNRATFYLYRRGELRGRKAIVALPGFKVADLSYWLISPYFKEMLRQDYDILFYMLPFHLSRKEEGKRDGEGMFTSNTAQNISTIYSLAREIRTSIEYLKKEGVSSIGGWGVSTGGGAGLLLSTLVEFDHFALIAPIVDWKTVTVDGEAMRELRTRLNQDGFSDQLLYRAYQGVSAINYENPLSPERIMIMYAEHDQLTPPDTIEVFAEIWGLTNIKSYNRSHVTIRLNLEMHRDYADFLDSLSRQLH